MSIAARVKWYLEVNRVPYEVITHPVSHTCDVTQAAGEIPGEKLAKAVVLGDEQGYVMPILPADRELDLQKVNRLLARNLRPADAAEASSLFFDCHEGAIPPVGSAYGIPTIIDDGLLGVTDIYFEGGDHSDLVHIDGADFVALIPDATHADLCAESG